MQQFASQCRRYGSAAALLLVALLMLQSTVLAQQTGTITGTVFDTSNAVIPGAKVVLTNAATKDTRQTISNGEGYFTFAGVVTGTYDVKIEMKGFKSWILTGVSISPNDKRNLSGINLAIGTIGDVVTVEAIASQVQVVDSGERSATLSAKDIRNMTLQGRDVTELVKVLPGFNNFTNSGGLQNKTGYDPTITSIGSSVGNGYNANGTPNRGGADLLSDGAHIIDPGCNCNSTQTVNADMVQEVKVSTSNFGADSAKGPVVIQAVSKSGSSEFHGSTYLHFRDSNLNSNDYNFKQNKQARPKDRYWYPGANIGGPVRIPGTDFNKSNKLLFWTGYEYYNQSFPDQTTGGLVKAVVPTLSMRQGLFSNSLADNKAFCSIGGWLPQCDQTGVDGDGNPIPIIKGHLPNGQLAPANGDISSFIDPGGAAIMKLLPLPNLTATSSQPYNFVQSVLGSDTGYMFHGRVDYNFSESTKLYVSYNQQRDNNGVPVMLWWAPPQEIPFPGGFAAGNDSKTISGNLVKIFSPSLTNEFIATLSYLNAQYNYNNEAAVDRQALGYPYHGVFGASKVMPSISTGWWIPGYPMVYQQDADGYYSRKLLPTFADNLTKVFGTHTAKFGVNWEKAGNRQLNFDQQNGRLEFAPMGWSPIATDNPVANLLLGVSSNYYESNPSTTTDMSYWTLGFYGQDDWKISKRLTLNLGVRFTHDPGWTDNSGKYGLATWTGDLYNTDVAQGINVQPGMRWNAKDGSVPLSGRDVTPLFVAPRIGMAWDLFGTGRTVLRGGWGTYYYHDQYNDYANALSTSMGGRTCSTNYSPTTLAQIDAGTNLSCASVTGATAVNPSDHHQPATYTYNFTISQRTMKNSLLEVAYSGNQTSNMINPLQNKNIIPLGAYFKADPKDGIVHTVDDIKNNGRSQDYRPLSAYTKLYIIEHGAWANYNALQVSWNKPQGAFTYGMNYTFSKTMGINGQYNAQPDPLNIHNDYGVVNQDRTHVINATYSFDVGQRFHGNRFLGGFVNGWMLSGITSLQSGAPLQQSWKTNMGLSGASGSSTNLNADYRLGTPDYTVMPQILCNPTQWTEVGQYVNPACFGVAPVGQNGPYQMPYMRGPAFFNSDLALQKTFKMTERHNMQFRVSAFNFLNHPLVSFDQNNASNLTLVYKQQTDGTFKLTVPNAGAWGYPNEKFGRRVVEMSLKYAF